MPANLTRLIATLKRNFGVWLPDGITDPDTLARLFTVALANRKFGKSNRRRKRRVRLSQPWDESKHPRGQPENAGEFAPASGKQFPSGDELARAPGKHLKPGGEVRRVQVGGAHFVVKQAPRTREKGPLEALASHLARIAGVSMPAAEMTTMGGRPALVQEHVEGQTLKDIQAADPETGTHEARAALAKVPKEDIDRNALFDYLLGNSDVHHGNYMVTTDNRLVPIDKEMILGRGNITSQKFEPPHFLDLTQRDGAGMHHEFDRSTVKQMATAGDKMALALESRGMRKEARQVRDRAVVLKKLAESERPTAGELHKLGSQGVTPAGLGVLGKIRWHATKG